MQLTFLGTRGEIDERTRRRRLHTSLLASYRGANVMIDAGLDWLGKLKRVVFALPDAPLMQANGRSIQIESARLPQDS